jgi:hypothetical protein
MLARQARENADRAAVTLQCAWRLALAARRFQRLKRHRAMLMERKRLAGEAALVAAQVSAFAAARAGVRAARAVEEAEAALSQRRREATETVQCAWRQGQARGELNARKSAKVRTLCTPSKLTATARFTFSGPNAQPPNHQAAVLVQTQLSEVAASAAKNSAPAAEGCLSSNVAVSS